MFFINKSNCSSLTSVTIPNSVTKISDNAFINCSSLASIDIPNSITQIGKCAFKGCSSLTAITIPDSVTKIGKHVFSGCSFLTSSLSVIVPITLNENVLTQLGYDVKYENKGRNNQKTYLKRNEQDVIFLDIPTTYSYCGNNYMITQIGKSAFRGCSSLTSITIPDSVTKIGKSAFSGCSSLINITISNSITQIGDYAFSGCSSLTNITIPNSVTQIGKRAFSDCSSLTNVTIPSSVTQIWDYAFSGCSSLTNVTIPNSVTQIGNNTFKGCFSCEEVSHIKSCQKVDTSPKIRIYQLAKQLSISSREVMNILKDLGEQIRSHQGRISGLLANKIRSIVSKKER